MPRLIHLTRARHLARTFMPLVGVAAVLSGSVFWLRRVGLLDPETDWHPYQALLRAAKDAPGDFDMYFEVMRF